MADEILSPVQPTPEEKAAYEAQFGPAPLNPIRDFSAQELADLSVADKDHFDIVSAFRSQPDLHADAVIIQKAADALNLVKQRGFKFADLPTPKKAAVGLFETAKGFGKQVWNYANVAGNLVAGAAAELTGNEGLATGYAEDIGKRLASNIAGTEEAMTGLADIGSKIVGKAGRTVGLSKDFSQFTPQEKQNDLWAEVGKSEVQQQRLEGKGAFTSAVTQGESEKMNLDPEEVGTLAAGDPLSFYAFGKGFQALGAGAKTVAKAVAPGAVASAAAGIAKAGEKIVEVAPKLGGGAVQAAGKALETGGKIVQPVGKISSVAGPVAGAVGLLAGVDPLIAAGKGLLGGTGGVALRRAGEVSVDWGKSLANVGEQIAGKVPVRSAYAQGARDFLQALPGSAGAVAHGAAIDLGLAAATAETPQETEGMATFGTAIGLGKGALRTAGHVISGQLIAPREYGVNKTTPSSGQFKSLDAMHSQALRQASPGVRTRLNAVREFLQGTGANTDAFLGLDPAAIEKALVDSGISPETAKQWSQQEGFFTANIVGKDGAPRRVVVMNNVEAAPHESFHAVQDVLGESANREIDRIVRDAYADRWEQEGNTYARRLVGDMAGKDWREVILDSSGWGLNEAKERIYLDIANRIRNETGAEPAPGDVQKKVNDALGQLMDAAVQQNSHMEPNDIARHVWREVLSPGEAAEVADRYIARELAAENFDAAFKSGATQAPANSLPAKLGRVAGRLITALGGEPLAGRTSEFAKLPLRTPVVEAVTQAVKGAKPGVAPVESKAAPKNNEQQAAAKEAQKIAESAPEAPITPEASSPKEMLGTVAEAIANRGGVAIDYSSAKGTPAALVESNRPGRRAEIESARGGEGEREVRPKTLFPEKVVKTKNGKYQIFGWAPEVLEANAQKMWAALEEAGRQDLSPFAQKADFDASLQKFVANHKAGLTGAGEPLVVPKSVSDKGFFKTAEDVSKAEPIPQNEADFFNMLFNAKLPATTRISGKLPLNIVGQDISAATKPGRVEVPVVPVGEYTGEKAKAAGIEGRSVMEVNPLRKKIQEALGAKMPSLIEVNQMINLEHIKGIEHSPVGEPEVRANTLTLQAGFQPKAEIKPEHKMAPPEEIRGALDSNAIKFNGIQEGLPPRIPNMWSFEAINPADPKGMTANFMTKEGVSAAEVVKLADAKRAQMKWDAETPTAQAQPKAERDYETLVKPLLSKFSLSGIKEFHDDYTKAAQTLNKGFSEKEWDEKSFSEQSDIRKLLTLENELLNTKDGWANPYSAKDPSYGFEGLSGYKPTAVKNYAGISGTLEDWNKVAKQIVEDSDISWFQNVGGTEAIKNMASRLSEGSVTPENYKKLQGKEKSLAESFLEFKQRQDQGKTTDTMFADLGSSQAQPKAEAKPELMNKTPEELFDKVAKFTPDEFMKWVTDEAPKQQYSKVAHDLGINAPNREFVQRLKDEAKSIAEGVEQFKTSGDIAQGMTLANMAQFFREAAEAAEGSGSSGWYLRKYRPGYVAPFPVDAKAQFAPATLTEEEIRDVPGSEVNRPFPTYREASAGSENPWVRSSKNPENNAQKSNSGRTLMIQFDTDTQSLGGKITRDEASAYYDKLYSGAREGYARMADFWEIPQWMGFAAHFLDNADAYVVRDIAQAKKFLDAANYGHVIFSAMDVNAHAIRQLAEGYHGKLDVGGYTAPGTFDDVPNINWHNSLRDLANHIGVPYKEGVDYRHFVGSDSIPRLTLSSGCKYKCAFCTIEKVVKNTEDDVVHQQADAIAKLGTKLVYLNDKTFGQASNYQMLSELNTRMKEQNPNFQGFVVQTTASQMVKLPADWLAKSGIKFVELGIESYNDPILRDIHKPATESLIDKATDNLRKQGITLIPNVLVGLPGETAETYARTLDFLKRNADIISHANIYNLAVYKDTELAKKITTASPGDYDENVREKSFYTDPELHRVFAGDLYRLGESALDKTPEGMKSESAQAQPQAVERLRDAEDFWPGGYSSLAEQRRKVESGEVAGAEESLGLQAQPKKLSRDDQEKLAARLHAADLKKLAEQSKQTARPEKGYVAGEYWLGKGSLEFAPDGHLSWANEFHDKLRRATNGGQWRPPTPEDLRVNVYDLAESKGYHRVVVNSEGIQIGGTESAQTWDKLTRADKEAARALAFEKNLPILFRRKLVMERPRPDEPGNIEHGEYQPQKKKGEPEPYSDEWYAALPAWQRPIEKLNEKRIAEESARDAEDLSKYNVTKVKRKGPDLFIRNPSGFSKAWILPDGKIEQLGGMWHHDWLANTPEGVMAAKKYGVKVSPFEGSEDDITREAALKKGFIRVNQDLNNGGVTVEAMASKWNKRKDAVANLLEKNIDDVASVTISLLDDAAKNIVDQGHSKLFQFDTAKEKMQHLPLITEGEQRSRPSMASGPEFFEPPTMQSQPTPKRKLEQEGLPGIGAGREYVGNQAVAQMTREELQSHFPEAIVPSPRDVEIPSEITKSPLYKKGRSEAEAVEAFAERLVDFAKQYRDTPEFQSGAEWYSKFTPELKKAFGPDAQIFAELLAATSPQTAAAVNFNYAFDALRSLRDGRFAKIIPKFEQGLQMLSEDKWVGWYNKELKAGNIPRPPAQPTPAAFLETWINKHDLKPRQSNGALYGTHSLPVLQVFARKWLTESRGPKTLNFVKNLVGTGDEVTVDVWADRTLRRIGYDSKPRWRILPANVSSVAAEDFAFGQKAFRAAAEKMGMKPSALQGALWFAEKKLYSERGWSRLDLGNFSAELAKLPQLEAGYKQRTQAGKTQGVEKETPVAQTGDLFVEPRKLRK